MDNLKPSKHFCETGTLLDKEIYNQNYQLNQNTSSLTEEIIFSQNDHKFYLYNILNDNFVFYKDPLLKDGFITKYRMFYKCCEMLNKFNYKTFFPISRLFFYKKIGSDDSNMYDVIEYEDTIDFSIINDFFDNIKLNYVLPKMSLLNTDILVL